MRQYVFRDNRGRKRVIDAETLMEAVEYFQQFARSYESLQREQVNMVGFYGWSVKPTNSDGNYYLEHSGRVSNSQKSVWKRFVEINQIVNHYCEVQSPDDTQAQPVCGLPLEDVGSENLWTTTQVNELCPACSKVLNQPSDEGETDDQREP